MFKTRISAGLRIAKSGSFYLPAQSALHRPSWPNMHFKNIGFGLGPDEEIIGGLNLNMILKI
jgi:hypothetical protein